MILSSLGESARVPEGVGIAPSGARVPVLWGSLLWHIESLPAADPDFVASGGSSETYFLYHTQLNAPPPPPPLTRQQKKKI